MNDVDDFDLHARLVRMQMRLDGLDTAVTLLTKAVRDLLVQVEDLNARLRVIERATPLKRSKGSKPPKQRPLFQDEIPPPEDPRWHQ